MPKGIPFETKGILATGLKPENMIQNVEILERRRIASEIEVEDGIPSCKLYPDFEFG